MNGKRITNEKVLIDRVFSLIPFLGRCLADFANCEYALDDKGIIISIPDRELIGVLKIDPNIIYQLVITPDETTIIPYNTDTANFEETVLMENEIIYALDPQLVPTYKGLIPALVRYILNEDIMYSYDTKQALMAKFFK